MLLKQQAAREPHQRLRIIAVAYRLKMNRDFVPEHIVAEDLAQPRHLFGAHFEGVRPRRNVLVGGGNSRKVPDRRANVEKGCRLEALEQVAQDQGGRLLVECWFDAGPRRVGGPWDRQMAWNAERISTLRSRNDICVLRRWALISDCNVAASSRLTRVKWMLTRHIPRYRPIVLIARRYDAARCSTVTRNQLRGRRSHRMLRLVHDARRASICSYADLDEIAFPFASCRSNVLTAIK